MRVRRRSWLYLLLLLCIPLTSHGQELKPIVAVFQIQDKGGDLSNRLLLKLSDYLGASIAEGGDYQIVPPSDIRRALTLKKKESYRHCYDHGCQIELGRELAANKSLSTSVLRLGHTCVVTGAMYDLRRQTTDFTTKIKGECSESGLMESIDLLVARFRSWQQRRVAKFKSEESKVELPKDSPSSKLSVSTSPANAEIFIDGEPIGTSPVDVSVDPGRRKVEAKLACHVAVSKELELAGGASEEIQLELVKATAQVDVKTVDGDGEPVEAEISVDSRRVGTSPGRFDLPVCSKIIVASHSELGETSQALSLKESMEEELVLRLPGRKPAPQVVAATEEHPQPIGLQTEAVESKPEGLVSDQEPDSWYTSWWFWSIVGVVVVGGTLGGLAGGGVFEGDSGFSYVDVHWPR